MKSGGKTSVPVFSLPPDDLFLRLQKDILVFLLSRRFSPQTVCISGRVEQQQARKAHNLEVVGAIPTSATSIE